jgi:hypothetical protein
MSLKRTMLAAECPIQFCKTGRNCIYSSRTKKWSCTACTGVRIPNSAKSECVVSEAPGLAAEAAAAAGTCSCGPWSYLLSVQFNSGNYLAVYQTVP